MVVLYCKQYVYYNLQVLDTSGHPNTTNVAKALSLWPKGAYPANGVLQSNSIAEASTHPALRYGAEFSAVTRGALVETDGTGGLVLNTQLSLWRSPRAKLAFPA